MRVNEGKYIKEHTAKFFRQLTKSWYIFFLQLVGLSELISTRNDYAMFFNTAGFDQEARQGRLSAEEAKLWLENIKSSYITATSFYRAAFRTQSTRSFDKEKVDVPVLFLHAENDRYLTEESAHFALKEALTERAQKESKVFIVKESSHWIQFYGEKFIKEIDEFIRK